MEVYCCGPPGEFYWCGDRDNGWKCVDKCKLAGLQAGTGPWERCGEEFCCHPSLTCKQGVCVPKPRCGNVPCPSGQECCAGTQLMPRARCYDPDTQCCTPVKGVVPKRPMTKVEWCPNRQPKKNHTPRANGCGPEGGVVSPIIPNTFLRANLRPACDFHDICYETCRKSKAFCDQRFRTLMVQECRNVYAIGAGRLACQAQAQVYYLAVSRGGDDAYEAAQRAACDCC